MPRFPLPAVLGAAALALVLSGCSLGSDAFNENFPIDRPEGQPQQVVRTPTLLQDDLPYETPPLVVPLPGPTGGVPGDVPTTSAPFSPGPEGSQATQTEQ